MEMMDSNVWLYALLNHGAPEKEAIARDLARIRGRVVSVQVINEVCANLSRKAGWKPAELSLLIRSFQGRCQVFGLDSRVLIESCRLRELHGFSFWDEMIVAAALLAGCDTLFTEDMHHGLLVDGRLRIINPFAKP